MSPEHKVLNAKYIADLRAAKHAAEAWWEKMLGDGAALPELQFRWPDGPAAHPIVIGVIVRYQIACDEANQRMGRDDRMPINEFLIDSIDTRNSQDLVTFTNSLTYWPLSRDKDGKRV